MMIMDLRQNIVKGVEEEKKEHPKLGDDLIKRLVADHLKIDSDYYGKESFKESTDIEVEAKKMFNKLYKDLTPEEKEKVDNSVMSSHWLGEKFKEDLYDDISNKKFKKKYDELSKDQKDEVIMEYDDMKDKGGVEKLREEMSGMEEKELDNLNKKATKMFGVLFDDLSPEDKKIVKEERLVFTSAMGYDMWVTK